MSRNGKWAIKKFDRGLIMLLVLIVVFLAFGLLQVIINSPSLLMYSFHAVSIFAFFFLLLFCYFIYRSAKVTFTKTSWLIVLMAVIACIVLYTCVVLIKPKMYFFDSTNYYRGVLGLFEVYSQNPTNVFQVCKDIYWSICILDYSHVISALSAFPFFLTDLSGEAYILCTAYVVLPILCFLTGGILIKIGNSLHWKARKIKDSPLYNQRVGLLLL